MSSLESQGIVVGPDSDPGIWGPPAGTVIFQVRIDTRVIPWKSPKVLRSGSVPLKFQSKSYRHWKGWSSQIQVLLLFAWSSNVSPWPKAADLDMLFVMEKLSGLRNPDRTNCGKTLEDLLQGIAYENDRVIQGGDVRRVFIGDATGHPGRSSSWVGPERIHIRLTSIA